eukprot:CAMPEP_0178969778 /NCGR_PEP_ID=MMETSP0789-20121207/19082_1 /TAXON_ID=3005 /ORGANISM="Rhizosolenia setigera, Strain CCMP 1694" /LENGTH=200 /DNA_ID=CAMNT_0020656023 /DNA_START=29 /DNA_END=628 /DNA_ORIENTATION=+
MSPTKKRKPRKKKDPNAPKRPSSTFTLFVKENRAKIREQNPDLSFGDISKLVGQKFKELEGEAKERYIKLANEDKQRYKREMENYEPPAADSSSSDEENSSTSSVEDSSNEGSDDSGSDAPKMKWKGLKNSKEKKRKTRKKKDPNAPKRPLNAYTLYVSEYRAKIRIENPDLTFPQITKLVAEKYRALTPSEKEKYTEEA